MCQYIISFLLLISFLDITAQRNTVIRYLSTGSIDLEYIIKAADTEDGDTVLTEQKKLERQIKLGQYKEIMKLFADKMTDTMTAGYDGRFIKMTMSGEDRQTLYELPTKRFLVGRRRSPQDSNLFDTTYSEVFKCPEDTSCDHILVPVPEKGTRNILGFSCSNYLIQTRHGENLTSIWVTNEIKPVLPVHAMVKSPKIFLEGYTALEIQEFFGGESGSYNVQTAISILHPE